jgi:DNA polymerase
MQNRGKVMEGSAGVDAGFAGSALRIIATIHPSAVLRAPDAEGRREAYASLVADLKVVANALKSHG